jgi:hypothetical protein
MGELLVYFATFALAHKNNVRVIPIGSGPKSKKRRCVLRVHAPTSTFMKTHLGQPWLAPQATLF